MTVEKKEKLVNVAKYLGDSFHCKGIYAYLCMERVGRARGPINEPLALCKFITQQVKKTVQHCSLHNFYI